MSKSCDTVRKDREKKYEEADLLAAFRAGKSGSEFFYSDFLRDYIEERGIERNCTEVEESE